MAAARFPTAGRFATPSPAPLISPATSPRQSPAPPAQQRARALTSESAPTLEVSSDADLERKQRRRGKRSSVRLSGSGGSSIDNASYAAEEKEIEELLQACAECGDTARLAASLNAKLHRLEEVLRHEWTNQPTNQRLNVPIDRNMMHHAARCETRYIPPRALTRIDACTQENIRDMVEAGRTTEELASLLLQAEEQLESADAWLVEYTRQLGVRVLPEC